MSERVTCECGWNVFPGEQWPWEDGDGCASYRHCHDCGQELVIDDNGNPILGPTRDERERGQRALAQLEWLRTQGVRVSPMMLGGIGVGVSRIGAQDADEFYAHLASAIAPPAQEATKQERSACDVPSD